MSGLFSNIVHCSTRRSGARLNILTFKMSAAQQFSFAYTKNFFYMFGPVSDKKWNSIPENLPENFTMVLDDSLTGNPLPDINFDLVLYDHYEMSATALEYSKRLLIPIVRIENNIKKEKGKVCSDICIFSSKDIQEKWGGKKTDLCYPSIIEDQEQIKDFSLFWDRTFDMASQLECESIYE